MFSEPSYQEWKKHRKLVRIQRWVSVRFILLGPVLYTYKKEIVLVGLHDGLI